MNRLPTIDGLPCPEGHTRPDLARHHILATDSVKSIVEFSHTLLKDFYPTRLSSVTALRLHVRAHPGCAKYFRSQVRQAPAGVPLFDVPSTRSGVTIPAGL